MPRRYPFIDARNVRTTDDPGAARRFADPDEADHASAQLRSAIVRAFPLAEMVRHPHGTDRDRGFAVAVAPASWLAA